MGGFYLGMEEKEIVKIEKPGKYGNLTKKEFMHKVRIDKLIDRATNAHSFKGWLVASVKTARADKNEEVARLLEEVMLKYEYYEHNRNQPLIELELLGNWKGFDKIAVYDGFTNDFIIVEHRKDKLSGQVEQISHTIPHENVNRILFYIKKWKIGEKHKCYDFAEVIGQKDWKSLWKERKLYFMHYYFPVKVLEKIGIIKYGGRGEITRIR